MQSNQAPSSSSARYFQVVNEDEGGQHQLHSNAVVSSGWSLAATDSPPEAVDWDVTHHHHHPPQRKNTTQARRQSTQHEVQWQQSRQRQPLPPHYNQHLPITQHEQNPKSHPFRSGSTSGPSQSEYMYASRKNRKRSLPTSPIEEENRRNKDERDPSSAIHLNTYTNDSKVVASGIVNNDTKPKAKVRWW
jgi:hypothetical protein